MPERYSEKTLLERYLCIVEVIPKKLSWRKESSPRELRPFPDKRVFIFTGAFFKVGIISVKLLLEIPPHGRFVHIDNYKETYDDANRWEKKTLVDIHTSSTPVTRETLKMLFLELLDIVKQKQKLDEDAVHILRKESKATQTLFFPQF